ncbi:MAG: methyltransferase domain-containing protein [Hyphomicrobiales bacterium]|nr:methyltransferase domain-containing protein [Hyphomicrobiales bacterium]
MMDNAPPQLFDRRIKRLQRARIPASYTHPLLDALYERITQRLTEDITLPFPRVLATGHGTITLQHSLQATHGTDFWLHGENSPTRAAHLPTPSLCYDEEWLPFAEESLDLILSVLQLHWLNDLPGALVQARHALAEHGLFLGVLFGGATLYQLRECLMHAETRLLGGSAPRMIPMLDVKQAGMLMQRVGYVLPVADTETITLLYPDLSTLLQDLHQMGEGNALMQRDTRPIPRHILQEAEHLYRQRFANTEGLLPATFEIITLTGWRS